METGAYLIQKRRWYQFSIKKKKNRIRSRNAQVQEVGGYTAEDQTQIQSTRSFTVVID